MCWGFELFECVSRKGSQNIDLNCNIEVTKREKEDLKCRLGFVHKIRKAKN